MLMQQVRRAFLNNGIGVYNKSTAFKVSAQWVRAYANFLHMLISVWGHRVMSSEICEQLKVGIFPYLIEFLE